MDDLLSGTVPALEARGVTFRYPQVGAALAPEVLRGADLVVPEGAFCLLTGATGSGKTTLLRLAKPEIAPTGELGGTIRVFGEDVSSLAADAARSAGMVGYVFQSPQNQIVCDTVWHEMAFGLENLAVPEAEMRRRIAETCYFFGMEPWFRKATAELSGGQRQILALAATLAMRPRLLLLDEPTSMLDPIAERQFLSLLFRANRELGVTVVVATHQPGPMADYATMALRVESGRVFEVPLGGLGDDGLAGVPAVRDARGGSRPLGPSVVAVRDAWLRYDRHSPWVLRGLVLDVREGEVRAVIGGNGSGKSTLLGLVAGVRRAQRGGVRNSLGGSQALLPQDPKALLSCETVGEELLAWAPGGRGGAARYGMPEVRSVLARMGLDADAVLTRHPYDLSGGQQQLVALAKLLLVAPRLILMDEPTKGLDATSREAVARMVLESREAGATVVVATHDIGFARAVADSVTMVFDGQATVTEPTGQFLEGSWLWAPGGRAFAPGGEVAHG